MERVIATCLVDIAKHRVAIALRIRESGVRGETVTGLGRQRLDVGYRMCQCGEELQYCAWRGYYIKVNGKIALEQVIEGPVWEDSSWTWDMGCVSAVKSFSTALGGVIA
jgi:hypothetical protein